MGTTQITYDGYSSLKDFKLDINNTDANNRSLSLCFWLYLPANSSAFGSIILYQGNSDTSSNALFLALTANKELVLYPTRFVPQEGTNWNETKIPSARSKNEVPLNKWVHIGCEVTTDIMRLYINGEVTGEMCATCDSDGLKTVSIFGANEDISVKGYVYGVEMLPVMSSIKDYFVKDPPLQLTVDGLSGTDIEKDGDGAWVVAGGTASCRGNFSLDVVLTDAFGSPVNKEMEVVASLTYADNGARVEKQDDLEAPLLTSFDGIEFASSDRPSQLVNGRASFKLKISQLSSKCDNKLFRIKFFIPKMEKGYPFLEAFSHSIRSISRNQNARPSTLIWKRSTSAIHVVDGTSWLDGGCVEPMNNVVHEAKPTPSSKRVKIGQGNPFMTLMPDNVSKQWDRQNHEGDKPNSRTLTFEARHEPREQSYNSSYDSDSSEATNSCKSIESNGSPASDQTVFQYCLGNLTEKSLILKDLANSASEKDIMDFAMQVSQFSGCLHNWDQIRISKRMIEDGTKVWNLLSQNNYHVLWNNVIPVLRDQFMKISCCRNRILTQQDLEVLRRIGGCQGHVAQENFEKLWCWLYPAAFGLSQNGLNEMWDSRWIEGIVTKEEAESSLRGPGNSLVDPGTFVLRFPTSRSWPHPDAGNLIVTYVGSDFVIHHRLLSLNFFHSCGGKSLKEMLLEERELSRLGWITTRSLRFV
ncbi:SH2 domain-containing protein A-like [Bidens hawaiensis]|uniref:SH2 domain-containing protein A-like n=1 Tax=Bidens hawaiensis TaxID=980011 RepID=UPI004049875C